MGAEARETVLTLKADQLLDLAEEILGRGQALRFRAKGWSMHPFVLDGDVLTVIPAAAVPRLGDVILFRTPRRSVVVHRVVRTRPRGVVTKGDAASDLDGFVPFRDVLGVVSVVDRRGSRARLDAGWRHWLAPLLGWLSPWSERLRPVAAPGYRLLRAVGRLGRGEMGWQDLLVKMRVRLLYWGGVRRLLRKRCAAGDVLCRRATLSDAAGLAALNHEVSRLSGQARSREDWQEDWVQLLAHLRPEDLVAVAVCGGKVLGQVGLHRRGCSADGGTAEYRINGLLVAPGVRGCGIGELLTRFAIAHAPPEGRLVLAVHSSNWPAVGLYRKMGFRVTEDVLLEPGGGPDQVGMVWEPERSVVG